jgi:ABC-2 type transport system ATP-binding protein
MLLGLVFATSGSIELIGHRVPKQARQALVDVGSLIEGPAAYSHLSARRNLMLMDAAGPGGPRRTRRARITEVLEQVGLDAVGRRPVKAYSLGMRQRLGLAAALLRKPRLLVLDEPTNGLDPQGIREVRELLVALNEGGTTVFLSSHLLAEVEAMCTRVGVLDRGRLVLQDDLATLQRPTGRVLVRTADPDIAAGVLDGQLEHRDGDQLVVRGLAPEQLTAQLVRAGARITELVSERQPLQHVVLAVTSAGPDRVAGATTRGERGRRRRA